jgi:hypothetical protein
MFSFILIFKGNILLVRIELLSIYLIINYTDKLPSLVSDLFVHEMIFSIVTVVEIKKPWTIIFPGFHVCLFLASDLLEYEMIFSIVAVVKKS